MTRQKENPLLVRVREIKEEGERISVSVSREWLTNIPEFSEERGTHLEGPIQLSGLVKKEGENLRLQGRVEATLATFCTRCGEPITCQLFGEFETVLVKGPPPLAASEKLTPEDTARNYYEGQEVDFTPFFQEEIALQVPIQPLCREDCKGLCAHCGANLNLERCRCEKEEGDPRLAVLRNLKLKK